MPDTANKIISHLEDMIMDIIQNEAEKEKKRKIKHVHTDTQRREHSEPWDRFNPSSTCYLHTQKTVSEHFKK